MKRCCKCKESKPESEFGKHKSKKDGLAMECKLCRKESADLFRKLNPTHARDYLRMYRVKHPIRTRLKFRGVLCRHCNWAIGNVKESIQTLENIIIYLKKHNHATNQTTERASTTGGQKNKEAKCFNP